MTVVSTRGRERVFLSLVLALSVCMRAERRACRWLLHTVDREGASCRCTYSRMLACERERDRAAPEACAEGLLTVTTGGAGPLAPAATTLPAWALPISLLGRVVSTLRTSRSMSMSPGTKNCQWPLSAHTHIPKVTNRHDDPPGSHKRASACVAANTPAPRQGSG